MSTLEIISIIAIVVLMGNITALTVYIIFILKEVRMTVNKSNQILDDVHTTTSIISNPMTILAGIINGVTGIMAAKKSASTIFSRKKEN